MSEHQEAHAPTAEELPPIDEARLWRKVALHILPIVGLAYVISYIDRANLGYVAPAMSEDLGLTASQIGLAGGLFFIGYILVEVPSNMALRRFGARTWITRILVTWGMVTVATAWVSSAATLYVARIALGFAEAGLAAGILLYLTFWFPQAQRAWAIPGFMLAIPLSGVIGAPLAASILAWGPDITGMVGWRSLFLIEGLITIALGVVVYQGLPDRPDRARWLTEHERSFIEGRLRAEDEAKIAVGARTEMRQALLDPRVYALALVAFAITFGLYPLAFFLPTMLETLSASLGDTSGVTASLLAGIPSLFALVVMIVWARVAGRRSAVFSTVVPMLVGAVGLLLATVTGSGWFFVVAVCLSVAGIYTALPQFWRIPSLALSGAAAASGIALINSMSNLSGFAGPYLTGAVQTATGSFTWALVGIAVVMVVGVGILLTVGRRAERAGAAPGRLSER